MRPLPGLIPILCIAFMFGSSSLTAQINSVGGFEGDLPSYWTKGGEPGGSTLAWATDDSRSMGRSLKISKDVTAEAASWVSTNVADFWSPQHLKDVDMKIGAYVKTMDVNTNPATDDEKWYISYSFYNEGGGLIGETMLPIDQSVASSAGWVADTNGVGETILPEDSWRTIIKFVGGKDASGTVWADDFVLHGRGGAWAGQNWNTAVGVPEGWIYWLPPSGGNDGRLEKGYENTVVTSEEAHSGLSSLKFDLPFDRESGDAFVGTKRFLLDGDAGGKPMSADISKLSGVVAGDVLRLSVWVKASNLVPDSAAIAPVTWAAGFTYGFFKGNGNNDGFNNVDGFPVDTQWEFPAVTEFDWTQYSLDVTVPDDPTAAALAVRLHIYARFTGTIYFDDLRVEKLDVTDVASGPNTLVPSTYELGNNYPNPFNPTTNIQFGMPTEGNVSIVVYNMLGQKVRVLLNEHRVAGRHEVVWDGHDDSGAVVGSGLYFYQLRSQDALFTKKMLLLK